MLVKDPKYFFHSGVGVDDGDGEADGDLVMVDVDDGTRVSTYISGIQPTRPSLSWTSIQTRPLMISRP